EEIDSSRLGVSAVLLSSSEGVAKGARPPAGALCVSYVHSPMRYVWEVEDAYTTHVPGGVFGRAGLARVASPRAPVGAGGCRAGGGALAPVGFPRHRLPGPGGPEPEVPGGGESALLR